VRIHLQHLAEALKLKDIRMHITEEAENLLCEEGFDPQFGARPVKRVLQKQVLNELSKALLANKVSVSEIVVMDAIDRKIVFRRPIKQEEEIALVM
jgi:ATP-dependent Clp protease ATP-binding subunit ClpB